MYESSRKIRPRSETATVLLVTQEKITASLSTPAVAGLTFSAPKNLCRTATTFGSAFPPWSSSWASAAVERHKNAGRSIAQAGLIVCSISEPPFRDGRYTLTICEINPTGCRPAP